MAKTHLLEELNEFLKGQYMGIHSYERFIQQLQDPEIKKKFQGIQADHKEHAALVAKRIQDLGGVPVDDEGIIGSIQGFINGLNLPDTTAGLIKGAIKGESLGIKMSEEIVEGDLDFKSRRMIEAILEKDHTHVNLLNQLIR